MTFRELCTRQLLRNPIANIELLCDMEDPYRWPARKPTRVHFFQYPFFSSHGTFCCGRDTGKSTLGIRARMAFNTVFTKPKRRWVCLLVAHAAGRVEEALNEISEIFRRHPIMSSWGPKQEAHHDSRRGGTSQLAAKFFDTTNGVRYQIAWPGRTKAKDARNMKGLRCDALAIDEVQEIATSELAEILPIQRTNPGDADDVRQGAYLCFYGYPNGGPGKLKDAWDTRSTNETFFNMPRLCNPRFTRSKWRLECSNYNCDPSRNHYTPEYNHQILARYEDNEGGLRVFPDRILNCANIPDFEYIFLRPDDEVFIPIINGSYPFRVAGLDVGLPGVSALHIYGWTADEWHLLKCIHLVGFTDGPELVRPLKLILEGCNVSKLGMDSAAIGKTVYDTFRYSTDTKFSVHGYSSGNKLIEVRVEELTGMELSSRVRNAIERGDEKFAKIPVAEISITWLANMMRTEKWFYPQANLWPVGISQFQAYSRPEKGRAMFVPKGCHDIDAAKYAVLVVRAPNEDEVQPWIDGKRVVENFLFAGVA